MKTEAWNMAQRYAIFYLC